MKMFESQRGTRSIEEPSQRARIKRIVDDIRWGYSDGEDPEEPQIDREYLRIERIAKKLADKYLEAKRKPRRKLRV